MVYASARLQLQSREADIGTLSVAGCVHHLDGFAVRQIEFFNFWTKAM